MSRSTFDDECPSCRPAMLDVRTRLPLADDSPAMKIVNRLWGETTIAERQAWHRFTCLNSRAVDDLRLAKVFADRVEAALGGAASRSSKIT